MTRRKKRRADGGFVMVSRQVTRSPAFQALSSRATRLLIGLMDRYSGETNRISMSRDEAAAWLKSGTHQAREAFDDLLAKGMIRCAEAGTFNRKVSHATVWTLTMFGCNGQRATLDFLNWQPEPQPVEKKKTRVPARHGHGCQDGTAKTVTGARIATAMTKDGCQDGTATGARMAQHIESTMGERPQTKRTGFRDVVVAFPSPRGPTRAGAEGYPERGARIREARIARGLSQPDLAKLAGVRPPVVSMAERCQLNKQGGPAAGRTAYPKLEAALGLTPEANRAAHHQGAVWRTDRREPTE